MIWNVNRDPVVSTQTLDFESLRQSSVEFRNPELHETLFGTIRNVKHTSGHASVVLSVGGAVLGREHQHPGHIVVRSRSAVLIELQGPRVCVRVGILDDQGGLGCR